MLQELSQEIENTARAIVDEVHTALPGEIISFNAGSGLAIVQPNGKYVTSDGKSLAYPTITEVPLVFPFCQQTGVGIAFPVNKGDSCIIIISEVELDEWRSGAESEGSLRFDLTSAMAIPGLLWGGGDLISKAAKQNAVVVGASGAELIVSGDGVDVTVGETTFSVSDSGIAARGNLKVKGDIICTGDVKAGEISLKEHTHKSAEPGEDTGKAE